MDLAAVIRTEPGGLEVPHPRVVLAGLWTAVMLTYLLGDVLRIFAGDFEPGKLGGEIEASQGLYLIAAVVMLIPIVMIVLTLTVAHRWIRWASIAAAILLIVFNVAGVPYPGAYDNLLIVVSFVFIGLTVRYAWKWVP